MIAAPMTESVDVADLKSAAEKRAGSSPARGTTSNPSKTRPMPGFLP